jgi:alkanesulfonate monooxygenase SsuD/methylene tetrahydromethanopterin reductase-like flavin-dependent oxidoreductase (luciferase family)
LIERTAAVGTPERVAARIDEYLDAGAAHVIIAPATGHEPLAQARRFIDDVVPLLRRQPFPTQRAKELA